MAPRHIYVHDHEDTHVRITWGDVEIVLSAETGNLLGSIMAPAQQYQVVAVEHERGPVTTVMFIARKKDSRDDYETE